MAKKEGERKVKHKHIYDKSEKLFKEILKYVPAGTSSNFRLWGGAICPPGYEKCAMFGKKARGAYLWDVDGNKYVDYRMAFGPIILGHGYKPVLDAVHKAENDGALFGLNTEVEIEVAKKITKMIKSAEMVRFTNSGTESTMTAIRVARAYTKKNKILKFEGHYHGHHDYLLFSLAKKLSHNHHIVPEVASYGVPKPINDLIYVDQWNDFAGVEHTLKNHHKEIGAIICEPVTGNSSVIPPEKGFLNHLRELCDKYNVALIFDEVKTGFRLAPGGAQEIYNVTPDITTLAKAMGNGYPVAAVAGKKEFMELIGPGQVFHGGTYSANRISMVASNATLKELAKKEVFDHMNNVGGRLLKEIPKIFEDHKVNAILQGFPTMFKFMFTGKNKIVNCRESINACNLNLSLVLQRELLKRGVMIDEEPEEPIYISYSHGKKEADKMINALDDSLNAIKGHPLFRGMLA